MTLRRCFFSGGIPDGCRQNCLCTQLDRYTMNQANKGFLIGCVVNVIQYMIVSAYVWMPIFLNRSMPEASTRDIWLQLDRMASVLQTTHWKGSPHHHMQRKYIHKVNYRSDCAKHRKPMGWTIRLPHFKKIR